MSEASSRKLSDDLLRPLLETSWRFYALVAFLGSIVLMGLCTWAYQMYMGFGMTGINNPIFWAFYITNFVFWIGISHAGTLISAILRLVNAGWRRPVTRCAEVITAFALMIGAMFPIIHLGRPWLFFWLMPYPSERQIWPNFRSPLVWDFFAISTYLTISVVFFIVGLVPDIAAIRDRSTGLKRKIYAVCALGWEGSDSQWRHYRRAYGLLAALATPLVLSVHSVVSFDFAMALVPGWHSSLFAPFFVDGAIFSGFAMVLILIIPMRAVFGWHAYITDRHLDAMAKLTLVTSLVLTYFYLCEAGTAWYSGEHYERASLFARAFKSYKYTFWLQYICNSLIPLVLFWRKARTNLVILYVVSIFVLIGMWLERFNIIVPGLGYDFYPYTWGLYLPRLVDSTITVASFAWFFLLFLGFIRVMPSLSIVEVKEVLPHPLKHGAHGGHH